MTVASVVFAASAREQFETIQSWWTVNRPNAPDLFADELDAVLQLLTVNPRAGQRYAASRDVRRHLLVRSRYHAYYVFDEPSATGSRHHPRP